MEYVTVGPHLEENESRVQNVKTISNYAESINTQKKLESS